MKTPEIRQQTKPIHSQSTSLCMPPSKTTRRLRTLIMVVRTVLSFNPQSWADGRVVDNRWYAMGERSLPVRHIVGLEREASQRRGEERRQSDFPGGCPIDFAGPFWRDQVPTACRSRRRQ